MEIHSPLEQIQFEIPSSIELYIKRDDFDMIIMDIEGSEYFALQGMQKILSNTELLMIMKLKSDFSGKTKKELQEIYRKKANSSSGSTVSKTKADTNDMYSEQEMDQLTRRMATMNDAEYNKVMEKYDRTLAFYKNKK